MKSSQTKRVEEAVLTARQRSRRRWRLNNPERNRELQGRYRKENPDVYRNAQLKHRYGITLDDFNKLMWKQQGKCAICRSEPEEGKNLHVDHCHETGKVRGLLCRKCNQALGLIEDEPEILERMSQYLAQTVLGLPLAKSWVRFQRRLRRAA